ncbi:MAG: DUF1553 domain-containing protein [Isosphaeraceae bacterium]
MTTFDAPGGVQACTRRLRSNTPLQALTLLNDPAMVEMARPSGLAARVLRDSPPPAGERERLRNAFLVCLGREPSDPELTVLEQLFRRENRDDGLPGAGGTSSQTAGWTAVARVLFNLDEFVTRE